MGRPVARGEERNGSTTPLPMSARRPSNMNSFLPAVVPQNSMAGQQRLQISELQFDNHTIIIFVLEDTIRNPSKSLFWLSSDALLWIKEVEMVDSADDFEILAIN